MRPSWHESENHYWNAAARGAHQARKLARDHFQFETSDSRAGRRDRNYYIVLNAGLPYIILEGVESIIITKSGRTWDTFAI